MSVGPNYLHKRQSYQEPALEDGSPGKRARTEALGEAETRPCAVHAMVRIEDWNWALLDMDVSDFTSTDMLMALVHDKMFKDCFTDEIRLDSSEVWVLKHAKAFEGPGAEVSAASAVRLWSRYCISEIVDIDSKDPSKAGVVEQDGFMQVFVYVGLWRPKERFLSKQESALAAIVPLHGLVLNETMDWGARLDNFLVGRIQEAFDLVMIYFFRLRGAQKPAIALLPHMSGLGKTCLSLLFPTVLARKPERTAAARLEALEDIMSGVAWSMFKMELSDAEREIICDACCEDSVIVATLKVVLKEQLRERMAFIHALANSKPLLITAFPCVEPLQHIRNQICEQLLKPTRRTSYDDERSVTTHDIIKRLAHVPGRQLVIVIDEYYRWNVEQYNSMNGALAEWSLRGVCIILAGISSHTIIQQRTNESTLRMVQVSMSPLLPSQVAEIIMQGFALGKITTIPNKEAISTFAGNLVAATGGHSRACTTFLKCAIRRGDYSVPKGEDRMTGVLDVEASIAKHLDSIADGCTPLRTVLQNVVLPVILCAAINKTAITTDAPVGEGPMTYGDALIGFPLPFVHVGRDRVHFVVGSLVLPALTRLAAVRPA